MLPFSNEFAYKIYKQKYAHEGEEWADTVDRVVTAIGYSYVRSAMEIGYSFLEVDSWPPVPIHST